MNRIVVIINLKQRALGYLNRGIESLMISYMAMIILSIKHFIDQ